MRDYQAAHELERIRGLVAFNVQGAKERRRVNQFATWYSFPDGSKLMIYPHRSAADCWHPGWCGTKDDSRLGPMQGVPLRINR